MNDPNKGRRRWLIALSICAFVFLCLWAIWSRSDIAMAAGGLERQLAAAKKEGVPLEPDDLRSKPRLAAKDNAADDYRATFAALKQLDAKHLSTSGIWYSNFMRGQATPEELKQEREYMLAMEPVWPKLEAAASKKGLDFDYQWELGFDVLFPEYVHLKGLTKSLVLRSRIQTMNGDTEGALRTLRSAAHLSGHLQSERILIGALVRMAMDSIVLAELQHVLKPTETRPEILREAKAVVEALGPPIDFKKSIGGEIVCGRITLHNLDKPDTAKGIAGPEDPQSEILTRLGKFKVLRDAFESRLVEEYRIFLRDLPDDPEDYARITKASKASEARTTSSRGWSYMLNSIFFPVFSQAGEAFQRDAAQRRVALAAIAVLEQRAKAGSLPANLAVPGRQGQDPFDDKPLRYKPGGSGFIVYSIGPDRKDNGGARRKTTGGSPGDEYDIVFEPGYTPPPQKKPKGRAKS